jgi:hypothetical protein
VYYTTAELNYYLEEALRTWAVAARYWKGRDTLPTVSGTAFYDLTSSLSVGLRNQTVTDAYLQTSMLYSLLEDTSIPYAGTEQFTQAQITAALQRRRDQFLVETGCHLTLLTHAYTPNAEGRTVLTDTVIDVRRAAWLDSDSRYWLMWRDDEHGAMSHSPDWLQTPGTPQAYSVSASPPLTVQLFSPPLASGSLDLITVQSGATLNPAGGVVMGVPDDFTWVVRFGALADLLGKDGQAYDPTRAQYCEQRWDEGVALARLGGSVVQAQLSNVPVQLAGLYELESHTPNWQNIQDTPEQCFLAGLNILGFSPVPNGIFSLSVDVIRNAPIPTGDTDYLEVGREELEAILQYAQHLASFKMHGQEFESTKKHYENFWKLAMLRNSRLAASARNFGVLNDRSQQEETGRPRLAAETRR